MAQLGLSSGKPGLLVAPDSFQGGTVEQTLTTTIADVKSRKVRKKDGTEITIYDVQTPDAGTWSTSVRSIAQQAFDLKGQIVQLATKTEMNGIYENNYLNGVLPAERGFDQPDVPMPNLSPPTRPQSQLPEPVDKDYQSNPVLLRRDAAKVAAVLSSSPAEFWANLDQLVHWFNDGVKPSWASAEQNQDDIPF